MNVFISWSGDRSRQLAEALHTFLPLVMHNVDPWMSKVDIDAGSRWFEAIASNLERSRFGLICVTREALASPWVVFEAGALSKQLEVARVVPILFDLDFRELTGPLAQFQSKKIDKAGIFDVVQAINRSSDPPIAESRIQQLFEPLWEIFSARIREIPTEPLDAKKPRPQLEVLEDLVASVRSLDARLREVPDGCPFAIGSTKTSPLGPVEDQMRAGMRQASELVDKAMAEMSAAVSVGIKHVEHEMHGVSPLLAAAARVGLENVYPTRAAALSDFGAYVDEEVERPGPAFGRIWIVASSFKGFLEASSVRFDGRRAMERLAQTKCDLRILMTDPRVVDLRAKQERRTSGEISMEVKINLAYLKRIGVRRESIRFYGGTPTVFGVATTDRMLLNPYPYEMEAYRCFAMVVHRVPAVESDVFSQYLRYHFQEPWVAAEEMASESWDSLEVPTPPP